MARQKGFIKLTGKIGDVSMYKTKNGYLAREKGGIEADRIKNDPAFVRTRENNQEFGISASAGKLLRDSIRPLMQNASDSLVVSRLTKIMTQIKVLDTTSPRGKRSVGTGIADPQAKTLLKGFNFNKEAILGSILYNQRTLDTATGIITIPDLVPTNDVAAPAGATHIAIRGAWAKVDFATFEANMQETNTVNLPLDATSTDVVLTPAAVPTGTGTDLFFLMVEFFQEVNGNQYSLKNGAYNALSIIDAL